MLYVSTRNRHDSYTANRALRENNAPDGGLFAPFFLPVFDKHSVQKLTLDSFGDNVAVILNAFFPSKLTGKDVELCCGRCPVRVLDLPRRLIIAETWHNPSGDFSYIENALFGLLCGDRSDNVPSNWTKIAIRIALLFGAYCATAEAKNCDVIDLSVDTKDLIMPAAAWYARKMGLPIGTIICSSEDSSLVWDLFHRGELSPTSDAGEIAGLERMIYASLGCDAALTFVSVCAARKAFLLDETQLSVLGEGMFAAVVSKKRMQSVIGSFYRSNGYIPDSAVALSYSGLQDFRATTGESRRTMLLSFTNPGTRTAEISALLGIPEAEIETAMNRWRG